MGLFAQRHSCSSFSKVSQSRLTFLNGLFRIDFLSTDTTKLLTRIKDSERGDFSFAMPDLNTTTKKKGKKRVLVDMSNIEEPAIDDFTLNDREMNKFTTNLSEITINEGYFHNVQDSDFTDWVENQCLY